MKGAGSCLITIIIYILLLCASLFNNIYPNPSVSVLVRQPTDWNFSLATVSPKRDQLFYLFSNRGVILNLVTGQKRQVKKRCDGTSWLDNDTLLCNNSEAPYLLDTTDLSRTSIESIDAEKQSYTKLISEIDRVYRIDSYFSDYNYLIKSTDEKFYYLSNVKKPFGPNISMTLIPYRDQGLDKVSPDGKYYFRYNNENWLRIYDNTNDQLVREISLPGRFQVAGWMYDSSGVIYMTERGYFDFNSHHIYKLNVSLKEGLIRLARNSLIGFIFLFGIPYLLRDIKTVSPKRRWL